MYSILTIFWDDCRILVLIHIHLKYFIECVFTMGHYSLCAILQGCLLTKFMVKKNQNCWAIILEYLFMKMIEKNYDFYGILEGSVFMKTMDNINYIICTILHGCLFMIILSKQNHRLYHPTGMSLHEEDG